MQQLCWIQFEAICAVTGHSSEKVVNVYVANYRVQQVRSWNALALCGSVSSSAIQRQLLSSAGLQDLPTSAKGIRSSDGNHYNINIKITTIIL